MNCVIWDNWRIANYDAETLLELTPPADSLYDLNGGALLLEVIFTENYPLEAPITRSFITPMSMTKGSLVLSGGFL